MAIFFSQMSESEDCQICPKTILSSGHKCLNHASCIFENQYYPSRCDTCKTDILKADKNVRKGIEYNPRKDKVI